MQRTIGLKAIPLTRENNIYVGGTIEIFFYRSRQSGLYMRAQGFTCIDLASGNVDFHEYSPFSPSLLHVAGIRLDETCLHI